MNPLSHDEVVQRLRTELHHVKRSLPADVPEDSHFGTELHMDSLEIVEFVARAERAFRVPIGDDEWESLTTLRLVADYIQQRAAA